MPWEDNVAVARAELEAKHEARELVLKMCRVIIQTCSKAIKSVHRRDNETALALVAAAREMVREARVMVSSHGELLYAGYIQDAEKEMVEAALTLAMVKGEDLPDSTALGVSAQTYLNGAGEAASELRRFLLDRLRGGDVAEAERLLSLMESVYQDLTTFDFPDSLTGGLRRTCDALRAVVERTRSDVTMTIVQKQLIDELHAARK